jgi:hypothetical protein
MQDFVLCDSIGKIFVLQVIKNSIMFSSNTCVSKHYFKNIMLWTISSVQIKIENSVMDSVYSSIGLNNYHYVAYLVSSISLSTLLSDIVVNQI